MDDEISAPKPLAVKILIAGKLIGSKRTQTYDLIKQGKLEAIKIGRSTRVTMRSIEALIEQAAADAATRKAK